MALVFAIYKKQKNIAFGLAWYMVTLLPAALLTKHHFDHHLYLPLYGLCLAISAFLFGLIGSIKPKIGTLIIFILCLFYSFLMYPSFKDWHQNTSLAPTLSDSTLKSFERIFPKIPDQINVLIYPRPKWALLDGSSAINFLYSKFDGITIKPYDSQEEFVSAITAPSNPPNTFALRYNPINGELTLIDAPLVNTKK